MMTDLVELAIFKSSVQAISEEMGVVLRRTSYSPNIKERRDYSCAVFDREGEAIAMGDHMPVHLGSMATAVRAALDRFTFDPGDIAMLNDPFAGGTHLPDVTLVQPVFADVFAGGDSPCFFVASRAHHADIGGRFPGSMGLCEEIYQEGLRIPPVKIVRRGELERDLLAVLLSNVRTPAEREGDLTAQIGACRVGEARLLEVIAKVGVSQATVLAEELLNYSERLLAAELAAVPHGVFQAEDFLDGDGYSERPIAIRVALSLEPKEAKVHVDFSGTDPQARGAVNAVFAVTYSAVYYVFRCLLPPFAPATSGMMRRITVSAPEGSVVNAKAPAAVAGGNVETSQRIVDVLLRALAQALPERVPAASSGTMSNLTIGGIDVRSGSPFAYYETIAGGMGARPNRDGISGVHTHMTNSLNTPVEALEYAYPLRVLRYGYRRGSGGAGRFRGGDGLVREIELLSSARVTLLSDRRHQAPYGLAQGAAGEVGAAFLQKKTGEQTELASKGSFECEAGDVVRVETPGGGGWGGG